MTHTWPGPGCSLGSSPTSVCGHYQPLQALEQEGSIPDVPDDTICAGSSPSKDTCLKDNWTPACFWVQVLARCLKHQVTAASPLQGKAPAINSHPTRPQHTRDNTPTP